MAPFRQLSFAGGEIAPVLWGRTDLSHRAMALAKMRNFFAARTGAAVSRPGTVFIARSADEIAAGNVRLIPFIFSEDQSYVLEFTSNRIRFFSSGGQIQTVWPPWGSGVTYALNDRVQGWRSIQNGNMGNDPALSPLWWVADNSDVPYEINTIFCYPSADLPTLKYVQSGDVLTLTHPNHPPRELRRLGHATWTLTDIDFDRAVPDVVPKVWEPLPAEDVDHPARDWAYMVSEMYRDTNGYEFETKATLCTQQIRFNGNPWEASLTYTVGWFVTEGLTQYRALTVNTNKLPSANPGDWVVDASPALPPSASSAIPSKLVIYPDKKQRIQFTSSGAGLLPYYFVGFRVYRGNGGGFGWIGDSRSTDFIDIGDEPDYSKSPPKGVNPFKVYASDGTTLLRTEKPAVCAYYEERRVFANTNERPAFLFFSGTGDYSNFDRAMLANSEDALEYELAARRREAIRGLVPLEKLVVLSNASLWSFGGGGGAPLSAAWDAPAVDAKVHLEVGSNWLDPLVVTDTVLMSRAKGAGVRDVFYDLERRSYTGGDVSFYAQHLFLKRSIVDWTYAEDPWGLVWAVRNDGKLLSLTYDRELGVKGWALHTTFENDKIEAVCAVPEGDEDAVYLSVQRYCPTETPPGRRFIERMASRVLPLDVSGNPDPKEMIALDSSLSYRGGPKVTVVSGLTHLNSRQVWALADGVPLGPFTVTAGEIDISEHIEEGAKIIHVGLLYQPELELLDLAEAKTKQKNVTHGYLEVEGSRGVYVGETLEKQLNLWKQRTVEDSYQAVTPATTIIKVAVSGSWNYGGRMAVRQADPLFLTIFAAAREVSGGGP